MNNEDIDKMQSKATNWAVCLCCLSVLLLLFSISLFGLGIADIVVNATDDSCQDETYNILRIIAGSILVGTIILSYLWQCCCNKKNEGEEKTKPTGNSTISTIGTGANLILNIVSLAIYCTSDKKSTITSDSFNILIADLVMDVLTIILLILIICISCSIIRSVKKTLVKALNENKEEEEA